MLSFKRNQARTRKLQESVSHFSERELIESNLFNFHKVYSIITQKQIFFTMNSESELKKIFYKLVHSFTMFL